MKYHIVIFAILSILLSACSDDDQIQPAEKRSFTIEKPLDFQNMEYGQKIAFVKYTTNCSSIFDQLVFQPDTLILELTPSFIPNNFYVSEYYTPYSESFDAQPGAVYYEITEAEDYLLIPDRHESAIFWFYANDTLRINPVATVNLTQDACFLKHDNDQVFVGNDIGTVDKFRLGNEVYEDKTAVSCEPFFDLDAYILYDQNTFLANHVTWFGENNVQGWLKLDDQ